MKVKKLNIGCGKGIKPGWVNHDIADLPGVDTIHDLEIFPWPFDDNSFDEIYMKDVLEHLPDTVKTLEELHRIAVTNCKIFIAVPYWNSWEAITDPTHKRNFNEFTFEFFDPEMWRCQDRPYYSTARFKIVKQGFYIALLQPYLKIPFIGKERVVFNGFAKRLLGFFASYFSNVIIGLDIYLEKK